MTHTYIWRVEHHWAKCGMYNRSDDTDIDGSPIADFVDICNRLNVSSSMQTHPAPHIDFQFDDYMKVVDSWVYGFANHEQFMKWTINSSVRALLDLRGFVIRVFRVRDYVRGYTQAAFDMDTAEEVDCMSVSTFAATGDSTAAYEQSVDLSSYREYA